MLGVVVVAKDLVAGAIFTGIGAAALLVACAFGGERALFFSRAEETTGTVVELRDSPLSNTTRRGKYPVVEYTPRTGLPRRCEGVSSWPPKYRVSQRVAVFYDADDPDDGRLDSFIQLWLAPAIAGGIALLFLPFGALLLTLHARRRSLERLRATGTPTLGTVVSAATSSVEEWGQTVQVLTLRALDPTNGEQREFQSHRVPGKGDEWLGKQLTIYVDSRQPRRYLVDAPAPGS